MVVEIKTNKQKLATEPSLPPWSPVRALVTMVTV